jgi:hypothetical protein
VKKIQNSRRYQSLFGARRITTVAFVLLSTIPLPAGGKEEITVRSSSVNKDVVLVEAEVNGRPVELECFVSLHCNIPKEGHYLMRRGIQGKATYMDCPNVNLYERSASGKQGKKIGQYCLLGE